MEDHGVPAQNYVQTAISYHILFIPLASLKTLFAFDPFEKSFLFSSKLVDVERRVIPTTLRMSTMQRRLEFLQVISIQPKAFPLFAFDVPRMYALKPEEGVVAS